MAKSTVRAAVFAIFNKHLPMRAERGNTAFRKEVIAEVMETFDCTLSSASTYYNTAFKQAKLETPELVAGLGRPAEKNNGGRKAKILVSVVEKETGIVVASGISRNAAADMLALAAARKEPELVVEPYAAPEEAANNEQQEPGEDAAPEAGSVEGNDDTLQTTAQDDSVVVLEDADILPEQTAQDLSNADAAL